MGVALALYCGYGRYRPFTAAIMNVAFYTAVRVDAAPFFRLLVDAAPFLLVWTLTLYTAVSVYAAYILRFGWMLPLLML